MIFLEELERIYNMLVRKTRKSFITIDGLIENLSYKNSHELITAIKQLHADGKVTFRSCCNGGRFETRILVVGESELKIAPAAPKRSNSTKKQHAKK